MEILQEITTIQDYYITANNYLYTDVDDKRHIYDLNLAYKLNKHPYEYLETIDIISAHIDSNGIGYFEKNEMGEYEGYFGWFDGVASLVLWDIFKEDIYTILTQYISEND